MKDFDIDTAREAAQGLKQFMGMSDAELEEHISFGFNRGLLAHSQEMAQAKIIAEVTESKYCSAGCKVGQKFVLQAFPAMLLPEESDCPLCVKAIGPVADLVHQLWDRMSEGLDPNDGQAQFASCLDQGIKYGGLGNVRFKVYVQKDAQAS
jgi:uncharacterized repeat protein (TIGR04076 family)